jgi:hypothetical protein
MRYNMKIVLYILIVNSGEKDHYSVEFISSFCAKTPLVLIKKLEFTPFPRYVEFYSKRMIFGDILKQGSKWNA